jgi:glycosyltransferase involved in cell wall biosynthesis
MRISLIIPIYNEADNILPLYQEVAAIVEQHAYEAEIFFINDGSRDASPIVLDSLADKDPRVKVVHFRKNFGQTAAISAGFDLATGDVIIPMDGDCQNDPNDIPKFIAEIERGYDVVSGWRKNRQDKALSRKLPSRIANLLIARIGGVPLNDYGCTMKAYRPDVVKGIRLYGEMHRFIPIYAAWEGARITEIVANHRARTRGSSKYGINRTFKVLMDLMVLKFLEGFYQKPMYIFGGFGILSIIASFLTFLLMVFLRVRGIATFIETPLPALAVTFFMIGVLGTMLGLLSEMQVRTYFESQGKTAYRIRRSKNYDPGKV